MSRKNKRPRGRRRRAAKYRATLRTPHVAGFNLPAGEQRETDASLAPQTARHHHGSRRRDLDDVLNYATPASRIDHDLPRLYVWRGSLNPSAVRIWEQIKDEAPKSDRDLVGYDEYYDYVIRNKRKSSEAQAERRRKKRRLEYEAEQAALAEAEATIRAKWRI